MNLTALIFLPQAASALSQEENDVDQEPDRDNNNNSNDNNNNNNELLSEEGRLLREHRRLLDTLDSALANVVQLAEDVLPADG
jgi:hypothetical protein